MSDLNTDYYFYADISLNHWSATLYARDFQPIGIVSCYRNAQFQESEYYFHFLSIHVSKLK